MRFRKCELIADIHSVLDQVNPQLWPDDQRERFQRRRMALGLVLNNQELTEDAYTQLVNSGSTAGYYLRAHEYCARTAQI